MSGFSPAARRTIRARADSWCERCGLKYGTQIHHRRPRGMGSTKRHETNQPGAGLLLCNDCHMFVELHRWEAKHNGWLVNQNQNPANVPVNYRGAWVWLDDLGNVSEVCE